MPERLSPTASRRITPEDSAAQDPEEFSQKPPGGLVVAVYGARAPHRVTTVASALARSFQALGLESVAYAELDPRVRRSSFPLEDHAASERVAIPGLNAEFVSDADNLWRLAVTRPRTLVVGDAKGMSTALEAIRVRFRVSVAGLEHQVNERTLAAFDAADRIVLVTEGTVPSLRGIQRVLRLCRRLNYPDEKMCLVANRADAPDTLPVADIAVALKREIFWKIPVGSSTELVGLAKKLLSE